MYKLVAVNNAQGAPDLVCERSGKADQVISESLASGKESVPDTVNAKHWIGINNGEDIQAINCSTQIRRTCMESRPDDWEF